MLATVTATETKESLKVKFNSKGDFVLFVCYRCKFEETTHIIIKSEILTSSDDPHMII